MTVRPTSHDTLPSIWETDVAVHLCVGNAYGNFVDNTVKHELPQLPWFTSEPSQHKYSKVPEIPSETNPLSTDDKNHQNLRHDHVAAQSLDLGPSESDASHCASNNAAGLSKKPHAVNERDRRRLENDVLRALEDLVRHGIRQELTALSANNRTEMGPSSSKLSILFGAYCEIKDLRRILDKLNDACGNFETRFEGVCDLQIAEMSQEQWHQIEDLNHLMRDFFLQLRSIQQTSHGRNDASLSQESQLSPPNRTPYESAEGSLDFDNDTVMVEHAFDGP